MIESMCSYFFPQSSKTIRRLKDLKEKMLQREREIGKVLYLTLLMTLYFTTWIDKTEKIVIWA